jgi:hypothetical protein
MNPVLSYPSASANLANEKGDRKSRGLTLGPDPQGSHVLNLPPAWYLIDALQAFTRDSSLWKTWYRELKVGCAPF